MMHDAVKNILYQLAEPDFTKRSVFLDQQQSTSNRIRGTILQFMSCLDLQSGFGASASLLFTCHFPLITVSVQFGGKD